MLCGPSLMDEYLFQFLCDEIQLQPRERIGQWQKTLSALMSTMLKAGMPMEKLNLPTYFEASRQARNAEEALLASLNACARQTQELSHVAWSCPETFGIWLTRTQGQRTSWEKNTLAFSCLSWLDLTGCNLMGLDLTGASLEETRLDGASLDGASLDGASLNGASLDGASLDWARLNGASLNGASLNGASLNGAILDEAILDGASLVKANLDGASLYWASLDGANLGDIYWNKKPQWSNVSGLEEALNVPEALKKQLGLS